MMNLFEELILLDSNLTPIFNTFLLKKAVILWGRQQILVESKEKNTEFQRNIQILVGSFSYIPKSLFDALRKMWKAVTA